MSAGWEGGLSRTATTTSQLGEVGRKRHKGHAESGLGFNLIILHGTPMCVSLIYASVPAPYFPWELEGTEMACDL